MTTQKQNNEVRFAFFGTAPLAPGVLEELATAGFSAERVVSATDISPEYIAELSQSEWDVFLVASYGKKLPKAFLEIPKHGVVNVHPSLLPRLRGASPIRSAILNDDRELGVSIMLLDEELDHGPLLAQKKISVPVWPPHGRALDTLLAHAGGKLLAEILPLWLRGEIEPQPQNDDLATYCHVFKKEDGLLHLSADGYANLLKIRAYEGWPGAYTFFMRGTKKIRVQLLDAHLEGTTLVIDRVKPEGKGEMGYEDFLRGGARVA